MSATSMICSNFLKNLADWMSLWRVKGWFQSNPKFHAFIISSWDSQACVKHYTSAMFVLFQSKLCAAFDCTISDFGESVNMSKYGVSSHKKKFEHTVEFNSWNASILLQEIWVYWNFVFNTNGEDPKVSMGNRYRELCRLQTHIVISLI